MLYPVAILCGGLGTRMWPVTETIPKALIPVLDEPFIAHLLRLLASNGFQRAVLCVGHMGEMIEEFVGEANRFGIHVEYSYDGKKRLGTAGAIRKALTRLGDRFFVVYGDSYPACDYRAIQSAFEDSGKDGLMTVFHNRGALEPSNVVVRGSTVVRYEKGRSDAEFEYIDYGVEVFRAMPFECIPDATAADLAEVVNALIARRSLAALEIADRFYEVGSPSGLRETAAFIGRSS